MPDGKISAGFAETLAPSPLIGTGQAKSGSESSIVDGSLIDLHVKLIHQLAAPLGSGGKLIVAGFGEDPDRADPKTGELGCRLRPIITHVLVGDVAGMIEAISGLAVRPNYNAYTPLAVFRAELPVGKKGAEGDILAVLGLVADFDDSDAPRWADRLPFRPNYVLETSSKRFQAFCLFDEPQPLLSAKPLAQQLKHFAECDHGTADLSHVWRVAGCPNWPNSAKIATGRARQPQLVKIVRPWDGSVVPIADLNYALWFPRSHGSPRTADELPRGQQNAGGPEAHGEPDEIVGGQGNGVLIDTLVRSFPKNLRDRIIGPPRADRSKALFYVINALIARRLNDLTIKEIIQRYPDAIGAKYTGCPDLDREIDRIRSKSSRREKSKTEAAARGPKNRRVIEVEGGALPAIVDEAEAALIERDLEIYELGDKVVRPANEPIRTTKDRTILGLRLVPVGVNDLIERMTRAGNFQRYDKRSDQYVPIDCPRAVAATYLERTGTRRLRKLTAITTCPVLRPDRTLLDEPGFDYGTGILFDPQGTAYPQIPVRPTRNDALAALTHLKDLISDFPFIDGPSRSVALSGFLTCLSRLALATAPLHGFDSPTPGTGKIETR